MSDEDLIREFKLMDCEVEIKPPEPIDPRDIRLAEFKFIVSSVLNDLPTKRDWLDPCLEKAMRSLVENS